MTICAGTSTVAVNVCTDVSERIVNRLRTMQIFQPRLLVKPRRRSSRAHVVLTIGQLAGHAGVRYGITTRAGCFPSPRGMRLDIADTAPRP